MSVTLPQPLPAPLMPSVPSTRQKAQHPKVNVEEKAKLSIRKDVALAVGGGLVAGSLLKGYLSSSNRMYRQLEIQRELHDLKALTLFAAPGLALLLLLNWASEPPPTIHTYTYYPPHRFWWL
jgi:hypothetical protein